MKEHVFQIVRGFCMGMADIVPGVSGGTVALVLGIYERLVTAISRFDREFFRLMLKGKIVAAAKHIDFIFLITLLAGILCGIVTMLLLVNALLSNDARRPYTLAAFAGMIIGSAIVVMRGLRVDNPQQIPLHVALVIAGLVVAGWIALQSDPAGLKNPELIYLFICGAIGICAMILPGISGAMILLLLGVYMHVSDLVHQVMHADINSNNVTRVLIFGCGCIFGLLCFSKVLKWLLAKYHSLTIATLVGLMVGSLPKLWPFQKNLTPELDFRDAKLERVFSKLFEEFSGIQIGGVIVTLLVATVLVISVERFANKTEPRMEES